MNDKHKLQEAEHKYAYARRELDEIRAKFYEVALSLWNVTEEMDYEEAEAQYANAPSVFKLPECTTFRQWEEWYFDHTDKARLQGMLLDASVVIDTLKTK